MFTIIVSAVDACLTLTDVCLTICILSTKKLYLSVRRVQPPLMKKAGACGCGCAIL